MSGFSTATAPMTIEGSSLLDQADFEVQLQLMIDKLR